MMSMLLDRLATMLRVESGALVISTLTTLDSEASVARFKMTRLGGEVYGWVPDEGAFCLPFGIQLAQCKKIET
jgi:hypothetical protein